MVAPALLDGIGAAGLPALETELTSEFLDLVTTFFPGELYEKHISSSLGTTGNSE